MLGRALRGGLTVAAVAAATVLVGTVHAPAAKAEPECLYGSYDFNRDRHVDLAAGLPGASGGAGAVEVNLSVEDGGYAPVRVRPDGLQPGDAFGTAVSEVASYEDEGDDLLCSQLVVGAPGRDVGGVKDAGAVFVFTFDNDGKVELVHELVQGKDGVPGTPTAGARFGAALAGEVHPEGIAPVRTPLYVGAPGATVDGAKGAGQVVRLIFDNDGTIDGTAVSQGHGVPGTSEAGDGFGTSVAAELYGAIIGAPGENGGAGAVAFAFSNTQEIKAKLVTQNSPGVPGVSEAGDHFGQAVLRVPPTSDVDDDQILVGLPGEAIGSKAGAGSVIRFLNVLTNGTGYTQDSPGVAGAAEAGDAFGSSLAAFGGHKLVAGAPGEDVGTVKDAGAVTALGGNEAWDQNTAGVADTVEAGDRFGATLADLSYEGNDVLPLVGVPGENGGAGLVQYGGAGFAGKAWTATGAAAGDHFGAGLGRTD